MFLKIKDFGNIGGFGENRDKNYLKKYYEFSNSRVADKGEDNQ